MSAMNEILAFDPFSHAIEFTPDRIQSAIAGAVNNVSGCAEGDMKITVDGFDTDESNQIQVGDYIVLASDTAAYRITRIVKTADEITELSIYPGLSAASAALGVDDAVVNVGGPDVVLDMGVVGDEGLKITQATGSTEQRDESGVVRDRRIWYENVNCDMPLISITVKNYLLLIPGAYRIQDGAVVSRFELGVKSGIFKALTGKMVFKDIDDITNKEKWLTIPKAVVTIEQVEIPKGREGWITIPVKIDMAPDMNATGERKNRMFFVGDGSADWDAV